jgi:hypothetical protein
MVAPVYTLIWPQMDPKKAWPLRKTPHKDGNVYIINVRVCNTTVKI